MDLNTHTHQRTHGRANATKGKGEFRNALFLSLFGHVCIIIIPLLVGMYIADGAQARSPSSDFDEPLIVSARIVNVPSTLPSSASLSQNSNKQVEFMPEKVEVPLLAKQEELSPKAEVGENAVVKKTGGDFSAQINALDELLNSPALEIKEDQIVQTEASPAKVDLGFFEDNVSSLGADMFVAPTREKPEKKNISLQEKEVLYIDPLVRYQRKIVRALQDAMRINDAMRGSVCIMDLKISTDGLVLDASAKKGKAVLCKEASRAALRVEKLPMPEDQSLYASLEKLTIIITP